MATDDFAVVVGIRTYPSIRPLKGPCRDALEFIEWLQDENGGNVPVGNIDCSLTDDFPDPDNTKHPNMSEVGELFAKYVDHGTTEDDYFGRRLYIYLAGHGFSESQDLSGAAALYTAEARQSWSPHLAGTEYARWLHHRAVFQEIVFVMDCCRTASFIHPMSGGWLPRLTASPRKGEVRTFFAYAVPDGLPAREREIDGVWRGIFTTAFLDALKNAGPNDAGEIRGTELRNHLHSVLAQEQPPKIEVDDQRDVTFFVNSDPQLKETRVRLKSYSDGMVVRILDGYGVEVLQVSPTQSEFAVSLVPDRLYKAVVEGTDRYDLFEVPKDEPTL